MAHEDTAPEEVLRAAAAEVSTPSVKRRLRLFRQTLPPLLAKATGSASDTTLLVDIIFQTLPLYSDRASRKVVDDMFIKAITEFTFMKPFAVALLQCITKNLEGTNPLSCYKLFRWSTYLLKFTQLATFYKKMFSRLANAQVALCQVSFRKYQNFKKLLVPLFSEFTEIYKMYMEEVRNSNLLTRDSPAFISILLDFTITSPLFCSEYKPVFLDLYVKIILRSNERPSEAASEAFKPLFLVIEPEEIQNLLLPPCKIMLKRNPEIVVHSIGNLLMMVPFHLRKYFMDFMPVVLQEARHQDQQRRLDAVNIVATLSHECSDLDTLVFIFNAIKAILGGSEGKLSLPYQRVGMLNTLEKLSKFSPKQISRLAPSVSSFLLMFYKGDGVEEVKLAALSALGSWASVSSEAVQPDVVSFITAGLKEKNNLRKGHLKLIRAICKNSDCLTKVTSLLDHLILLSKTSFRKGIQHLDGIYALYAISMLAGIHAKADSSIVKEKIWKSIAPSVPSLISVQLFSKLVDEDCLTCVDLLQSLLVDHLPCVNEYFSIHSLLQMLIYLVCHPSWEVRKMAYVATKKVLSKSADLVEDLLFLFSNLMSLVGERMPLFKQSDMDSPADSQLPFIPSTGVLAKCLLLIAPYALNHKWRSYSRIISCFHHPCISSSGSPAGVWKRLGLKQQEKFLEELISPNISAICKELLSQDGLFSSSKQDQRAALCSLSTLMTISPNDTFTEFEKHFIELPCRALHDGFNENDIKIFRTPEGKLSTEGIRVDKAKLSLLEKEASIRADVGHVQKNLVLMLDALGELANANLAFTRGQLPRLTNCVEPFLGSPIVSDAAFSAMVRLAHCTADPLCNWSTDIAAAIRVTYVKQFETVLDLMEEDSKKSASSDLFESLVTRLLKACKKKVLPANTFNFIFPILERVLLSSKKTCVHDDALQILSMHLDPILPLPRPRMLSVLYHVFSIDHGYLNLIGHMLNQLCLGLNCNDLAQALVGVYAKEVHVRLACLTAIKSVPCYSVQRDLQVSTILSIAIHDPEKEVAKLAKELWEHFSCDVCTDHSGILDAVSHKNYNVRVAAAKALALVLNQDTMQDILSTLFSVYTRDRSPGAEFVRQGIALALHSVSDILDAKDLHIILEFLIRSGLDDPNLDVRSRMINTVTLIIDKHGEENVSLLLPFFESYFNKTAEDKETFALFRKCYRVFTGAVAKHLSEGDPKVHSAFEKLLDVLDTPLEAADPPRNMRFEFSFVPFLDHLKSVGATIFDAVIFEGELRNALRGKCFVSLGETGSELYHMLWELIESFHVRKRCVERFSHQHVRYIPRLNRLVFSEKIKDFPFTPEMYRNNVQDVGGILHLFRYDPDKLEKREPNILEVDRCKGTLPQYLSVLLAQIAVMGSAVDGLTAKWRSIYDLDLAGKSSSAKIALVLGVDLHYDYLSISQQENLRDCLGQVRASWTDLAETVPTLKNVLDFKVWDKDKKFFVQTYYDQLSVQSLWKCGRNHQTHSHGNQLSEKEIEAIFSFIFHVTLSKITKVIIQTYVEPSSDARKKQNKLNIMQILKLK